MLTEELIRAKRDGAVLDPADIRAYVEGVTSGDVSDAQIAAFGMAVFFRGMTPPETAALTLATYALVKEQGTDAAAFEQFKALVENIGARPLVVEAAAHDAAVALISHLPQLLASTLATLLGAEHAGEVADHELAQRLAATGWRDMTRLAGSSWSVWRDICLTNQPNLSVALTAMIAELQSLKEALDGRDFNALRDLFAAANRSVEEQRALHYGRFEKL